VDRPSAREFLVRTVDVGTFVSWDTPPEHRALDATYEAELRAAAESSDADEAVLTGEARIGGHRIALVVSEFGFLGGSIGVATARRWSPRSSGPPRCGCRCWPPRPPAAPGCRKARSRSSR
jgi:acetyl-CoA carboxylase beta subunit